MCTCCSLSSSLASLKELFITGNVLTKLPEGFGQLSSLVKLQASFNSLESIPEELGELPNLELMRVRATLKIHTLVHYSTCMWTLLLHRSVPAHSPTPSISASAFSNTVNLIVSCDHAPHAPHAPKGSCLQYLESSDCHLCEVL